jgi:hypothetical protein
MKMKTTFILFAFVLLAAKSRGQTVVVTDNSTYVTGQASSVLDVYSVSKGFLAPRMTTAQRIAITAPAVGLLVYQIDGVTGFYYYTGSAWSSLSSGSGWSLTGNSGTSYPTNFLGTTDLKSLRFQTNSVQGLMLDSLGNVGIGASPVWTSGTYQEKLLVSAGTTSSYNAIVARGSVNNYFQLNIQNQSSGNTASSDVVATADNGTETVNYVDLGINSSTNTQNVYGAPNDAYLYTTGNNFLIGTGTAAKALVFMTGGTTQSTNERMRIDGTTGFVGIGITTPATALHVVGTNPLTLFGVQTGALTDSILTITSGTVRKISLSSLAGTVWSITGNAGTNSSTNFLGTTDNQSLVFKANNQLSGKIDVSLNNTLFGYEAGLVTTASNNTALGYSALKANTTGASNTALGAAAGATNTTGADNTFIGNGADATVTNLSNATAIGYNAKAAISNTLILGGTGAGAVNVGIGTTSPATALQVVGTNPLTLNGVQVGAISDSILTIASGTVRKLPFTTLTSGASWALTGNAGTNYGTNFLGTTDLKSLRFQTNSVQGMLLDSLGNVGIGASPVWTTGIYQEKLLVSAGTTNSYNAIVARGSVNNYFQLNIQNQSSGNTASSDVVATADNGTETVNYVDLGINSSTNTQNVYGAANDAYLYTTGNNFLIGTGTAAKALVFMTGGTTQSTNERMRIDGTTGFVGIGTTAPATALHVAATTNPLTLMGVQTGAVTDSILTIISGTVRKLAPSALAASTSWSLTGNAGTSYATNYLGTIDLKSLRFRTNTTQGLMLDSLGNVGVGTSPGFTAGTYQEKFLVDAGTTSSYNAIIARGSLNNYLQLNIQNLSNGNNASSDVVATADDGTETTNFIDMGINSSTNNAGVMGGPNDAYLYTVANNLLLGAGTVGNVIAFLTGGTAPSNERMRIDGSGNVGIGKTTPAYKVDVHGRGNFDSTVSATGYSSTFQTLTYASSLTWDQTKGCTSAVTLTGNATLSITNAVAGMYGLIRVTQDATGSRTLALPAGSKVINGGGGVVTLTTTADATDVLSYFYDGTGYYWTVGYNYN